ncbi:hypothetical protein [Fodinicola acaciae]|uniref:hypothetical protein n=1 Tax=Fodinicola acaciae TaxID=2681555 RepID=UPI001C9E4905|nr:hypothetical protein [Fodinicola acaciae]
MTSSASKAMLRRSAALVLAAGALTLGVSSAAYATHGDNGTVKIHETGTPVPDRNNEPHVCGFYLDAFGFDKPQAVSWKIEQQAPTKGTNSKSGTITLVSGAGRTDDISLPDGHYKLTWNFAGENGEGKHKTFWVECEKPTPPSHHPKPSCSPSASASASPSASPSPSRSSSTAPVVNPSTTEASTSGSLPVTGTSLPILIGAAVAMIAAGLTLVLVLGRRLRRS